MLMLLTHNFQTNYLSSPFSNSLHNFAISAEKDKHMNRSAEAILNCEQRASGIVYHKMKKP